MVFYILLEIERTLLGMLSHLRIRTKIGNFEIKKSGGKDVVGRFDGFSVKLGTGTVYIFVPNHFDGQKYFNLPFLQPALLCEILNCVILGLGGQWTLWANLELTNGQ